MKQRRQVGWRRAVGVTGVLAVVAAIAPYASERIVFEPLPAGAVADLVVVEKSKRRLQVFQEGRLLKSYRVSLGSAPVGPKQQEGDGRTPEGRYVIDWRKADSQFHLALHVSYPSAADTEHARAAGRDPGGLIMIHGLRNGLGLVGPLHRVADWTDGCVAVTNLEIQELWESVPDGTPIDLRP